MWIWKCVTPHPPIIVPEVGKGNEAPAANTVTAMKRLSARLSPLIPDIVLVLSPHAPYSEGLCVILADRYEGDFSRFGASGRKWSFRGAVEEGETLTREISRNLPVTILRPQKGALDHASLVPLSFLGESWNGRTRLVLANPIGMSPKDAYKLGKILADFDHDATWGFIGSADLSHRLIPGAPAGYDAQGRFFDENVVRSIREGSGAELLSLPDSLVEAAGECGFRSVATFLGLTEKEHRTVLSYEGPFGVGYCVACAALDPALYLPSVARRAVEEMLETGRVLSAPPVDDDPVLSAANACFVSLKTGDGNLRGCIGTILPQHAALVEEVISNAVSAAFHDPRFPPVNRTELTDLHFSVDVLSHPERVNGIEELNPRIYGVILEQGARRGVLLPDLEGVDSVEEQLRIASMKAGIRDPLSSSLYRFTVNRYKERRHSPEER